MTGVITAKKEVSAGHDPGAAPLKLEEFLPYRLNVVASLVSQALSRIYVDRYGIDVPEWRILVTLGQYETMTAKAVGAHSHMHKTKVSRAVGELERRKLVVRRENRADRREAFLSLTPSGLTSSAQRNSVTRRGCANPHTGRYAHSQEKCLPHWRPGRRPTNGRSGPPGSSERRRSRSSNGGGSRRACSRHRCGRTRPGSRG